MQNKNNILENVSPEDFVNFFRLLEVRYDALTQTESIASEIQLEISSEDINWSGITGTQTLTWGINLNQKVELFDTGATTNTYYKHLSGKFKPFENFKLRGSYNVTRISIEVDKVYFDIFNGLNHQIRSNGAQSQTVPATLSEITNSNQIIVTLNDPNNIINLTTNDSVIIYQNGSYIEEHLITSLSLKTFRISNSTLTTFNNITIAKVANSRFVTNDSWYVYEIPDDDLDMISTLDAERYLKDIVLQEPYPKPKSSTSIDEPYYDFKFTVEDADGNTASQTIRVNTPTQIVPWTSTYTSKSVITQIGMEINILKDVWFAGTHDTYKIYYIMDHYDPNNTYDTRVPVALSKDANYAQYTRLTIDDYTFTVANGDDIILYNADQYTGQYRVSYVSDNLDTFLIPVRIDNPELLTGVELGRMETQGEKNYLKNGDDMNTRQWMHYLHHEYKFTVTDNYIYRLFAENDWFEPQGTDKLLREVIIRADYGIADDIITFTEGPNTIKSSPYDKYSKSYTLDWKHVDLRELYSSFQGNSISTQTIIKAGSSLSIPLPQNIRRDPNPYPLSQYSFTVSNSEMIFRDPTRILNQKEYSNKFVVPPTISENNLTLVTNEGQPDDFVIQIAFSTTFEGKDVKMNWIVNLRVAAKDDLIAAADFEGRYYFLSGESDTQSIKTTRYNQISFKDSIFQKPYSAFKDATAVDFENTLYLGIKDDNSIINFSNVDETNYAINLKGCNLSSANFKNADLRGALYDSNTVFSQGTTLDNSIVNPKELFGIISSGSKPSLRNLSFSTARVRLLTKRTLRKIVERKMEKL